MGDVFKELIFTDDSSDNWLFKKYYYSGSNSRYWTFQIALNLLIQRTTNPTIVETGCQRMKDDLGAGMSTSIFGEYCLRYGGKLYTVDLIKSNLDICKVCTARYSKHIEYILSDSLAWLKNTKDVTANLLYLDSLDYPVSPDGTKSVNPAGEKAAQEHCLNELKIALESKVAIPSTLILIDDNQLPGGGKSRLAKEYLRKQGYICLFDLQQSLWLKSL